MKLVTTLTDSFRPGLQALLRSLVVNSGQALDMTVLCYEPIQDTESLTRIGIPLEFIHKEDLGHFEFPEQLAKNKRMEINFQKVLIWRLPYQETCLYLDADILCLNRIEPKPHLSVAVSQNQIGQAIGFDRSYSTPGYVFNCGVMFFKPDQGIYDGIQELAHKQKKQVNWGDQTLHNDYFHRTKEVKWLSPEWNQSVVVSEKYPYLFNLDDIRLLHYATPVKPWQGDPSRAGLKPLWDLWQKYYDDAK